MTAADEKLIEATRIGGNDTDRVVGLSLKALRQAAGLTQLQLAERLGVGQASISKIEQRGDVQISSLQRFVEALGAHLRIDALFTTGTDLIAARHQMLKGHFSDGVQYILPIFRNEPAPRRDVILSIKPAYSNKILEGAKTVELRRRFPLSGGRRAIAYIYSTSPVRALVGSAEITDVERLSLVDLWKRHGESAVIQKSDFDRYFRGLDEGFALKIANARPFSRPLNLVELKKQFDFHAPQSFLYAKPNLQRALQIEYSKLPD